MKLCVITAAKDEDGNQYDCLIQNHDPFDFHPKQAFVQGELLVVDDYGREVSGKGRKPSKWDVEYELFDFVDLDKAVQRSIEVKDW